MNRYRRLAQKSLPESTQNSCNGLCLNYASDSVSRKPNIISRKSSLRKVHGSQQDNIASSQQRPSKVMQSSSEDSLRVVVPAVGHGDVPYDSNVYFMLDAGSVMVDNLSLSQPIVENFHLNDVSEQPQIATTENSEEQLLDVEDNEGNSQSAEIVNSLNEVGKQSDYVKPDCAGTQHSPAKLSRVGEELVSLKDSRDVEPQGQTDTTVGQSEEYQDENQYVILQMGSQTLLVPVATFQQYCDAQQNGDDQNVANFFSQIEQALLDSNGETISGADKSKVSLPNTVLNGSQIERSENLSSVDLKREEHVELPLPSLFDGTNPPVEPSDSKLDNINASKVTSTELYSAGITNNGLNGDSCNEEPPSKKSKDDEEVRVKLMLSSSRKLAAKSDTECTKKENINIFRCGTCTMLFATKDLCMQHIYVVHKADPLKTQCDLRRTNETRFICHGCSRTFGSLAEFHKHNLVSHGSDSTITKDKVTSKSDVNLVPTKLNDQFACKTELDNGEKKCENIFNQQDSKKSSLNYPDSLDCSKCSKTFVSLFYYLLHGLLHMETTVGWVCQICSESFSCKPKLLEHFRVHCEIKSSSNLNSEGVVVKTEKGDCVKQYSEVSDPRFVNINKIAKSSGEVEDCGAAVEMHKTDLLLRRRGRRKNVHAASRSCSSPVNNYFTSADQGNNGADTSDSSVQHGSTSTDSDSKRQSGPDDKVTTTAFDSFQAENAQIGIQVSHSEIAKEATGREIVRRESQDGIIKIGHKINIADERLESQNYGTREYESSTKVGTNCDSSCNNGTTASTSPDNSLQNGVSHLGYEKSNSGDRETTQGKASSRALRSRQSAKLNKADDSSSPRAPVTASSRKTNTRRGNKTVYVDKQISAKQARPDTITEPTIRRTRRSSCQKTENVVKSLAQKGNADISKKEIGLLSARIGRKSSTGNTPKVNSHDTRNLEENGRRSGAEKRCLDNNILKGLRSAKKEEAVRLRSRSIVSTEDKGKRVRKNATTSRELLPEDWPKFELSTAKSKPTPSGRKKRGVYQPEQVASPDNRSRVQQSFIEIFNQVKKTGDSVKDRRNK